ncbi:uncharacterized protein CEXT_231411 [Caerostris extrusa]|uniref:Uncharacterized protein n=1 Tax=Caerostris extrusa TaxID=172846 RepID=A0AAV4WJM7_CAEEX|nr:uncharacterized protein CEXT_231411 [Caerostris extrusa]
MASHNCLSPQQARMIKRELRDDPGSSERRDKERERKKEKAEAEGVTGREKKRARECSPVKFITARIVVLGTPAAATSLGGAHQIGATRMRTGVADAPTKAYLAPVVFHGRLVDLARRGPAQQATFRVDKVFKGPQALAKSAVVIEFAFRKNSSKCRGAPYTEGQLELDSRYVVFAARRRQHRSKMIAVAQPEPYSKRKSVSKVLCANCGEWITYTTLTILQ